MTDDHFEVPSDPEGDFIGWFYSDVSGVEHEFKEGISLQNNMRVDAKYAEVPQIPTYDVFFIIRSQTIHKVLTAGSIEIPEVEDADFIGWFYKDENDAEHEFSKDTELYDDMVVEAKFSTPEQSNAGGSEDMGLYSFITGNGIGMTDNMIVESVAASVIFVMLALMTFLFVFKRQ